MALTLQDELRIVRVQSALRAVSGLLCDVGPGDRSELLASRSDLAELIALIAEALPEAVQA